MPQSWKAPAHDASPPQGGLFGFQVLVVEDEPLMSMLLEDMLAEFGCVVAGAASTVEEAMALILASSQIDAAILDVNLRGHPIFPVADILAARHVPFVFSTGNPSVELVDRYPGSRLLTKPYAPEDLADVLSDFVYEPRR